MRDDLTDLTAFATVAEERSFTRAAARLGVSQSALSHTMRALEKRLGVQLLARTTRSVSLTPAGSSLLTDLGPALERIRTSLAQVRRLSHSPSGRVRLVLPRSAVRMVLLPKLTKFTKTFPDVVLDVTTSNDPIDLAAGEFDAGIHIGELIQRDMIAARVSEDLRLAVVGSPDYFKQHGLPRNPQDLKEHLCIGFRFGPGVYRWEFEKGSKAFLPPRSGHVRRSRPGDQSSSEGNWPWNGSGGATQADDFTGPTNSGAAGLVSHFSRILSLLSESSEPSSSVGRAYQYTPCLNRTTVDGAKQ
jgi:DNA-binding transcriptional LysR family regulator